MSEVIAYKLNDSHDKIRNDFETLLQTTLKRKKFTQNESQIRQNFRNIWKRIRLLNSTQNQEQRYKRRKDIIKDILKILVTEIKNYKTNSISRLAQYAFPKQVLQHIPNLKKIQGEITWYRVLKLWLNAMMYHKLLSTDTQQTYDNIVRSVSVWAKNQQMKSVKEIDDEIAFCKETVNKEPFITPYIKSDEGVQLLISTDFNDRSIIPLFLKRSYEVQTYKNGIIRVHKYMPTILSIDDVIKRYNMYNYK